MRDYALNQALARGWGGVNALTRLLANWRRRRTLLQLEKLEDHVLRDIGVRRTDLAGVLSLPMSVDPVWELERRCRVRHSRITRDL